MQRKVLTLRPAQPPMIDFMRAVPRCGLWAGMGTGKTTAALVVIDILRLLGEVGGEPALVLGPMRVARDTWPEAVAEWDNFKHLKIMPLVECGPRERVRRLQTKGVDLFTINYEVSEWLVEHYLARWPFRIVIADESDRLKGMREKKGGVKLVNKDGSKTKRGSAARRAFQIGRIAHNMVDRWVNLTGTPAPAGLGDLWGQTWYLDKGKRLGATHTAFMQRWFRKKWNGYGVEPCPFAYEQIHAALADICLTIDPKDYYDLREPIRTPVYVDLPKRARALYNDMRDDSYMELAELGVGINAVNSAAVTTKLLQIAAGAVYTQRPEWVPVHDAKLDALESVVHEAGGEQLIVSYAFQSCKTRILRKYPKWVDLSTKAGMAAFKAGTVQGGVAHPKSLGHGVDGLQKNCRIVCFFSHDWKTGERMQLIERVGPMRQLQLGRDEPMFIYDIIARRTEDENVMKVHAGNGSVQDVLLEAMKHWRAYAVHH